MMPSWSALSYVSRCAVQCSLWIVAFSGGSANLAIAQSGAGSSSRDDGKVIAFLGSQRITDREVDFQLGRNREDNAFETAPLTPAVMHSTLHLIALQRQALQTMRVRKLSVSREDTERWLESNLQPLGEKALEATELLETMAAQSGVEESVLRDHFAFRISWQRYLRQQLTDANIAKHFENQRGRFDGSRFQIAILSLAVPPGESSIRGAATKVLGEVREELNNEKPDWDAIGKIVETHWKSPDFTLQKEVSVRGTGDLDPSVVTKLISLKPNDVSEPFQTATGMHLVKLIAIEPGAKKLMEVRDEVRAHMIIHLLEFLAKQSEAQLPLRMAE